jgi:hypothetical protein
VPTSLLIEPGLRTIQFLFLIYLIVLIQGFLKVPTLFKDAIYLECLKEGKDF